MIYLDYNATTPLASGVLEEMLPYFEQHFGNASSVHAAGREARAALDDARDRLAALLKVKAHELIFTSGGTEANNLAVLGLARSRTSKGRHLICATTEHHAVLHAFERLQKHEGFDVTWLPVDRHGLIAPDELAAQLRPDTTLVSIMAANNETGVIQPLVAIAEQCRSRGVLFHSDMVQAFGKVETDVSQVDAASFGAHKFYGPKGAGFLYLRGGLPIEPIQFGGSHEGQRRPGTENVPAVVGMAKAAEIVVSDHSLDPTHEHERTLRDELWQRIVAVAPRARQNGATDARLANTLNVSFPGLSSETLLIALDLEGVCASSGSACMVGSVVASHVLLAMGLPAELAGAAVRFSLGKSTTPAEIEEAGKAIERVVERLQNLTARAESYALA